MRFLASEGLAPDGAADALRAAATTASAGFLIRVAQALYALTGDPAWAAPVASNHW